MDNINSTIHHPIIGSLTLAMTRLNIYFGLFILLTGNISTIGNFVVFSSRTFRARACSIYLVAESVFTFIYLNSVLTTRIIQKGFQFPIYDRYDPICRIRQFLAEYSRQVAFVLFTLATMDRLLLTHRSAVYRRWSNRVSFAHKMTGIIAIVWFLFTGHRLFFFSTSSGICHALAGIYEKFDVSCEILMSAIVPPLVLIILGSGLLRNIRQVSRKKVAPTAAVPQTIHANLSYIHQIEEQITTMLLLQSSVAVFSFLFFGAQNLYSTITINWYRSRIRSAWEKVIIEVIRLLAYLFYSTSFYISLISSRGFRKQVLSSLGMKRHSKSAKSILTNAHTVPTNTMHVKERQEL